MCNAKFKTSDSEISKNIILNVFMMSIRHQDNFFCNYVTSKGELIAMVWARVGKDENRRIVSNHVFQKS